MFKKPNYKELEKRFHDLENAVLLTGQDLMFRYSRDGEYLDFFAPDWDQLLVEPKNFLGKNLKDVMPDEASDKLLYSIQKTIDQGETQLIEYELSFSEQDTRYYESRLTPTENGEAYAIVREITDGKIAQKKLYQSQKMLARTEQIAHLGSWEWKIATDEVTWSEELFRIFQRDPYDGAPSWAEHAELYPSEDFKALQQAVKIALVDGTPYEFEIRIIRKDGEIRVCDLKGFAELGKNGKPVYLFGLVHDITERKWSNEALLKRKSLHREAQRIAKIGHWELCLPSGTTRWSKEIFRIFGLDPAKGGPSFAAHKNLIHDEDWELFDRSIQTLSAKGTPFNIEFRILRSNGQIGWIHGKGSADKSEDGKAYRIFGTAQDITERKQLERQIQVSQKLESIGKLAGGVAHDFNNMLSVILGYLDFAFRKTKDNQDLYGDLKEIQKAALRSANLTKQLLAFARQQVIEPKVLNLNNTVESMLKMLRRLIGENIELSWLPVSRLWPVKIDPSQIDQILANLCVNARDAITGVGKLTIEMETKSFNEQYCKQHSGFIPGDFVVLAVSDNGCGMDKDTLNNLFVPFFTTKEVNQGTGLGLATVYGIVKQNNGFINVYSEPGQGAIFKIYLPRFYAADETPRVLVPENLMPTGSETILLVEDEPSILQMAGMMLELSGYSVLSAATPAEAIDLANSYVGKIHLLMTDVVMPKMDGRELAKKVIDICPAIKLLFMSGYTANIIADHGEVKEGVAFIQKPFSLKELTEKLRDVLDRAPRETQQ
ncbi:MAG: PAS domain-containing protein [Desulfobacterium sp.]|nr:PAS domain-containing protein [Desulfobacterium sp.]